MEKNMADWEKFFKTYGSVRIDMAYGFDGIQVEEFFQMIKARIAAESAIVLFPEEPK